MSVPRMARFKPHGCYFDVGNLMQGIPCFYDLPILFVVYILSLIPSIFYLPVITVNTTVT
ncbi:hypothetical protein CQP28_18005, partial [Yersinia pestis]|nr:hypothetical protein DJ56_2308 [Yersinia pestis]MRP12081.1 hypothetical protein [Yersinia pestis]MRP94621.1 hypothetical protein [Yersinia pestis]MRQ82509.1 hypothetical protein [Yersinia pestis]